ncbi:radical SAM protein [Synergistales bacterium]|nr:radical SAM protein [Synergistales bacterium]
MPESANILNISRYTERTQALGPFTRSALWVWGCSRSCGGCIYRLDRTPESRAFDIEELADIFCAISDAEGITISGGEPFEQASAAAAMLRAIRSRRDYGAIIYSGFTHEELKGEAKADAGVRALLEETDILIDGPYIAALDDGITPYRGSSNQRVIQCSSRYDDIIERYYNVTGRKAEIKISGRRAELNGVPSKAAIDAWQSLIEKYAARDEGKTVGRCPTPRKGGSAPLDPV